MLFQLPLRHKISTNSSNNKKQAYRTFHRPFKKHIAPLLKDSAIA